MEIEKWPETADSVLHIISKFIIINVSIIIIIIIIKLNAWFNVMWFLINQGVMARVYETVTVLCLLGTLVLGMTYVLSALIDYQKSSLHTLLSKLLTLYRSFNIPPESQRNGKAPPCFFIHGWTHLDDCRYYSRIRVHFRARCRTTERETFFGLGDCAIHVTNVYRGRYVANDGTLYVAMSIELYRYLVTH